MPLFNPDKITRLVSEMRKALNRLKSLAALHKESFLNDPDKIGSARYYFVVAIESCIDMCNHILSQNSYRAPEDYADTFQVLGEEGVFDEDFLKVLKDMARFRSRLIHLYWEVDDGQVYEILQSRLDDFKTFLRQIGAFLKLEEL
jgi:uncharacterized protein YutE (UPF0331/DUF86 family)